MPRMHLQAVKPGANCWEPHLLWITDTTAVGIKAPAGKKAHGTQQPLGILRQ